uniref:Uncharacterized protein n=1 Tax=Steinernema glaseri TaxID=37863 RepID=A0A1I7Z6I4_9BILA
MEDQHMTFGPESIQNLRRPSEVPLPQVIDPSLCVPVLFQECGLSSLQTDGCVFAFRDTRSDMTKSVCNTSLGAFLEMELSKEPCNNSNRKGAPGNLTHRVS